MNKLGANIAGGAIALAIWTFAPDSYHEDGDYYVDPWIDSYVEEYIAEGSVRTVPVAEWLAESDDNELFNVNRFSATDLANTMQSTFGIELQACVDSEWEANESSSLVATLGGVDDYKSVAKLVRTVIPENAEIDFGNDWMIVEMYY